MLAYSGQAGGPHGWIAAFSRVMRHAAGTDMLLIDVLPDEVLLWPAGCAPCCRWLSWHGLHVARTGGLPLIYNQYIIMGSGCASQWPCCHTAATRSDAAPLVNMWLGRCDKALHSAHPGSCGCHPWQGQLRLHAFCKGFRGSDLLLVHGPLVVPCLAGGRSPRKSHSPGKAAELFVGGGQGLKSLRASVVMRSQWGDRGLCVWRVCSSSSGQQQRCCCHL